MKLNDAAKRLRYRQTRSERAFARLVKTAFPDILFKQQYAIAPYIVDFYFPDHRLIVEIDGGQHADSLKDKIRDKSLRFRGFKVIRFWNHDTLTNKEGIYETLEQILGH